MPYKEKCIEYIEVNGE